jgi:sucrose-6-phosphate hydrolase SacC (GH32 family)
VARLAGISAGAFSPARALGAGWCLLAASFSFSFSFAGPAQGAAPDEPRRWMTNATRTWLVRERYLNLPIKNGAPKRLLSLDVAGRLAHQFELELADSQPDWWAFADLQAFRNQQVSLRIDKLREDSAALTTIAPADHVFGLTNLYRETWRPQFHFSSRRGWNNDPNGLVFLRGEYHLFYQHNPYGWSWGNMHWGHAVSRDLVRWRELGDALAPDELGTMFSGSAVVDDLNTTGFGRPGQPALVCMYTAAGGTSPWSQGRRFSQCLAYSLDRGRSWTKYVGNPVLPHLVAENRDPKALWHAPTRKWVMALYLDRNDYALFASPDLKSWTRLCEVRVPGASECPEFFALPLEGHPAQTRWVFYGGNGQYLLGQFDGKTFAPESGPHALHHGNCFYASQTYNHLPARDGRRIQVAWGQVNLPGMPFNQMMDFPVTLALRPTAEGPRVFVNPVREIRSLYGRAFRCRAQVLSPADAPLVVGRGELLDCAADFAPDTATEIEFNVRGTPVVYQVQRHELACLGRKARLSPDRGTVRLRFLADRASLEIFGNDGQLYMPMAALAPAENRTLTVQARGGAARLLAFAGHELKSAWASR